MSDSITASRPEATTCTKDAEWRVIHAGDEAGPCSLGELVKDAAAGRIDEADLVKPTGGLWTKAGDIGPIQEQFRLRRSLQEAIDKRSHFHGIWVSKKALVIGGCLLFALVPSISVLALRTTNDRPAPVFAKGKDQARPAFAKPNDQLPPPIVVNNIKPNDQPPPPPIVFNKITDEEHDLIQLGREIRNAPRAQPLTDIGKSFFVVPFVSAEASEALSANEIKFRVELRLRKFGFTVGPASPNKLWVQVDGIYPNGAKKEVMATNITLEVRTSVLTTTNRGYARTDATIWNGGYIGITGYPARTKHLQDSIDRSMDQLINEILAANPP